MKSDQKFVNGLQNPERVVSNEHILIEMIHKNYYQAVKIMIQLGAKLDIKAKNAITFPNSTEETFGASPFKIAFRFSYRDILTLIMINKENHQNGEQIKEIVREEMKRSEVIWNEVAGSPDQLLRAPLLTLDTEFLLPWDFHNSAFFRFSGYIERNLEGAKQRWRAWFGAYVP